MSMIFGVFDWRGSAEMGDISRDMLVACTPWPADGEGVEQGSGWILGCRQFHTTPQARLARQPAICSEAQIYLVYDGRLDNREPLAAAMGVELTPETTDESLILRAYREYGAELGKHLLGDFAIGIFDRQADELLLLRDHFGVRPLFIARSEGRFAFASNKAALLTLPWVDTRPDTTWIADLLAICKVDRETSLYRGIAAAPAAHAAIVSRHGATFRRYWELQVPSHTPRLTDADHIMHFRVLFEQAVACRLRSDTAIAAELSGGLDSSAVTAMAASLLAEKGQRLRAFSHILTPGEEQRAFPFLDEAQWSRSVAVSHANIDHCPVADCDQDMAATLRRMAALHSGPARNDMTLAGQPLFDLWEDHDGRVLLSGFGGDQAVSSLANGWEQEFVMRGQWRALARELRKTGKASILVGLRAVVRKLFGGSYVPEHRPETARNKAHNTANALTPALAEEAGYPQRGAAHPTRRNCGPVAQQECDAVSSPHLVYRLEDSAIGAASYGAEYRYPLLDVRLVEYYLAIPADLKIRDGVRRRVLRDALTGLVPEHVRMRPDKAGSTIPGLHRRVLAGQARLRSLWQRLTSTTEVGRYVRTDSVAQYIETLSAQGKNRDAIRPQTAFRAFQLGFWLEDRLADEGDQGGAPVTSSVQDNIEQ